MKKPNIAEQVVELAKEQRNATVFFQYDHFNGRLDIRNGDPWLYANRPDFEVAFRIDPHKVWRIIPLDLDDQDYTYALHYRVVFNGPDGDVGELPFH